MRFEFSPSFSSVLFLFHSRRPIFYRPVLLKNVVSQVDILLIDVRIEICGSNIPQLLNVVENSINWCIDIKSLLFDHILIMGKHLRCDFAAGI